MAALTPQQRKDQELRMRRAALAAAASGITVVLAALLTWAGYLDPAAAAIYSAIVAACVAFFYAIFRSDLNLRFADPTLSAAQLAAAGLAITYLVYEAGSVRAVAMAMYVMAFVFGTFTLSLRGMIALAAFYLACYGAAVGATALLDPAALDGKRELVRAAGFTILLVWIIVLGNHVNSLRRHLRDTNRRLQEAVARYQRVAELSSDWYWEQDSELRFTRVDGGFHRGDFDEFWRERIAELASTAPYRDVEIARRDERGEVTHAALVSSEPLCDADGAFIGYRGVGRDITERKRMEETIARMAAYDELTGLPNARFFSTALAHTIAEAKRERRRFALLYCDLDGFKPVNDALGHAAGDALLREVAVRLQTTLREADVIARVGGDEFVALGTTCHSADDARLFADRIHKALRDPFHIEEHAHDARISCSIGIAIYPDHAQAGAELLAAADRAMYAAKRAGRARHAMADTSSLRIPS
jgi:diguanylate cyclase (GGDEF)-like protein